MRIKRTEDMWALICDDWKYRSKDSNPKRDPMLCGVYPSRAEALEVANHEAVKGCLCDHYIAKCSVVVDTGRFYKIK